MTRRRPTTIRRRQLLGLVVSLLSGSMTAWTSPSTLARSWHHGARQQRQHQQESLQAAAATLSSGAFEQESVIILDQHATDERLGQHDLPQRRPRQSIDHVKEHHHQNDNYHRHQDTATIPRITHRDDYDMAAWRRGWTTVDSNECYELDRGVFPVDLLGTFYQNGPAKFQVGDNDLILHPFDGDGMIRAVTFCNGTAWYRHRFIETTGYQREQRAGKILYRGVFGTRKRAPWSNVLDITLKNVANTHVLCHNNRLFGLWDAGAPVEIDPLTLQTLNAHVTQYGDRFGAHYKEDPMTNTLCSFGLHPGLPNPNQNHRLVVSEHDHHGQLLHRQDYKLPGLAMGHDMGITRQYYIFLHPPCRMNLADFLLGRKGPAQCTEFDPRGVTTFWLIPRRGGREIGIALPGPPVFCTHVANAYENEKGMVVVDAVVAPSMKMCDADGAADTNARPIWETMEFDEYPAFQLVRYIVDPSNRQVVSSRILSSETGHVDFPVMHPDRVGQSYKYVYCNCAPSAVKNGPPQGLVKIDVDTGTLLEKWLPQTDEYLSEVIVAPKNNGATGEDDVYLIATLISGTANSEVVVFDGRNISQGPVGRARLQQRLPHALHGSFLAGYTPELTQQVRDTFSTLNR